MSSVYLASKWLSIYSAFYIIQWPNVMDCTKKSGQDVDFISLKTGKMMLFPFEWKYT